MARPLLSANTPREGRSRRCTCSLRGSGEIIGGSQREQRLAVLDERIAERGIDREHWAPHPSLRTGEGGGDLRRYGTVPHAGFGLGFEQTLAYVMGLSPTCATQSRTREPPGNARH